MTRNEMTNKEKVLHAIKFTEVYKKYSKEGVSIREAMCLKELYPSLLNSIEENDLLAGRTLKVEWAAVAFSPDVTLYSLAHGMGYFYREEVFASELSNSDDEEYKNTIKQLMDFWSKENTTIRVKDEFSEQMKKALPSDSFAGDVGVGFPLYRMTGACLNYERLIELGIPGLYREIEKYQNNAGNTKRQNKLYEGFKFVVDILKDSCIFYKNQALKQLEETADTKRRAELNKLAGVLENITKRSPETMMEAMQLMWIYSVIAGVMDYGRMDLYLGDLLAHDLETGELTEEGAVKLTESLWRLMVARKTVYHGRVIIGGRGRRNTASADQFALIALEASKRVKDIEPQLSLRFYEGSNPNLMEKAVEVICTGATYPMLYNDDINIPAIQNAFNVSYDVAEQYVPFGCGEYILDHKSFGSPNTVINTLKALEVTMRNGKEIIYGQDMGLKQGEFKDFKTFDDFYNAFKNQLVYYIEILAEQEALLYHEIGKIAPFLFMSLLYDGCLESGKGMFEGGLEYLGGTLESYGNINTVDSLIAIKELIYDKKLITHKRMLEALDADFVGYEKERKLMLEASKFGNDIEYGDNFAREMHDFEAKVIRDQAERVGLHSFLMVVINNSANTYLGRWTGASSDGRKATEYMANAINPVGGMDKNGVTAMLNSLVKIDPYHHAGTVQNLKLSKNLFKTSYEKVRALMDTYFKQGGTQLMVSVVGREDLENALKEPEKYSNLLVRVGGFSARFVELEPDVQQEVLSRTLHE